MELSSMEQEIKISIIEHFSGICDPRRQPLHILSEVLTIAICATIAGADNIVGIVRWAEYSSPQFLDQCDRW
jgi:hypothetical protein